jgi:predicted nuclease of restriction endonuclease-like (RecB) superfamily
MASIKPRTNPKPPKIKPVADMVRPTSGFYSSVRQLILNARARVARGVDLIQVQTNFEIGRRIILEEQKGEDRAAYGEAILRSLAEILTSEFGKGFSLTNLKLIRGFYLENHYRSPKITNPELTPPNVESSLLTPPLKGQTASDLFNPLQKGQTASDLFTSSYLPILPFTLSWSHYVFLLTIKNPAERSFYEIEASQQSWTVRELKRQFDSGLYERLALSRDAEGIRRLAREGQIVSHVNDLLKEPLVLEFLGLDAQVSFSESDLESAIINKLEHFLLELGKGFLFESRQKRFTFDGDHYFVDLVFYNRLLRCYVLIDLKIGKLTHQDLGQMQMYVNYFDRQIKTKSEKPTIGILLAKQRNKALVEITLPKDANIHTREYQLYLPTKEDLQHQLQNWIENARS